MKYLEFVTQRHKLLNEYAELHALENEDQYQELDSLDEGYQLNFFTIISYLEQETNRKVSVSSITSGLYKRLGVSMERIHKRSKQQVIEAVEDIARELSSGWQTVIKY